MRASYLSVDTIDFAVFHNSSMVEKKKCQPHYLVESVAVVYNLEDAGFFL